MEVLRILEKEKIVVRDLRRNAADPLVLRFKAVKEGIQWWEERGSTG